MSLKPTTQTIAPEQQHAAIDHARELADAIVLMIQTTPNFDDMTWPEIDAAMRLTSHNIKLCFTATGTVHPAPVEPPVVLSSRR